MSRAKTEALEIILKFLDCATRSTSEAAKATPSLDGKLALQRELRKLEDARRVCRINYHTFRNWCETGEYEVPEIKTFPVCDKCGQIKVK